MTTPRSTAEIAAAYVRQFNLALVPLPPRSKRPVEEDWGNLIITDPEAARAYYTAHPAANVGVALGPSRICSLDVDDMEAMRTICAEFGWDLDALVAATPTAQGKAPGLRLLFRVPEGVALAYHALTWPNRDDPKRRVTVFELRAADAGQQRQDVLPPSIHPETGEPYRWITLPSGKAGIPEPPAWLLAVWREWDALKPQMQDLCPWAPKRSIPAVPPRPPRQPGDEPSVIDAYDGAHSIEATLERYGYRRAGRRWLSPHSQTGLPGVVVLEEGNRAWIHHASDPLCSTESGRPVAPFDLFAHYEHGGDASKATKAAAAALGMSPPSREKRSAQRPPVASVDPETGEILEPPAANDNDPAAVDWWSPFADTNTKGRPLSTVENVQEALRRLGVTVRYNLIAKEVEILIPGAGWSIDNAANAALAWVTSACKRFGVPTEQLGDYLALLADLNPHNPVANWIKARPWDGRPRMRDWYNTIRAEGEEDDVRVWDLKAAMMRRWALSAVAAVFRPHGVSAHGVLVLQGEQYLGKTKWFRSLVPQELGLTQDGMILRPDDRDSVKQCVSNWLVELGELDATFRKADIAALKAFLTRDRDVLRRPYAKLDSTFARRTVFFASVNARQFLHDPSGNRRYWTISATAIDHDHGLDMQQVWAEVYEQHYLAGETWYLTPEEMGQLNDRNRDHEVLDPIRERLQTHLDWASPSTAWRWTTATDVMAEIGFDRPSRADVTQCGLLLQELNGGRRRKSAGKALALVPRKLMPGAMGEAA